MRKEIPVEIIEHIATLEEFASGYTQEVNIAKWNDGEPKWDIRRWNEDHTRMSKGITLFDYEMKKLVEAYLEYKKGEEK